METTSRNRRINVQIYNYIYVPSLLCAEMVWAELVMCRTGYVHSWPGTKQVGGEVEGLLSAKFDEEIKWK